MIGHAAGIFTVRGRGILALLTAAVLIKGGAHGLSLASSAPAHIATGGMGSVLALAFGASIGFEALRESLTAGGFHRVSQVSAGCGP